MACKVCGLSFPHSERFCKVLLEDKKEVDRNKPKVFSRASNTQMAEQLKLWQKNKNSKGK